jgi:hypothetical protein
MNDENLKTMQNIMHLIRQTQDIINQKYAQREGSYEIVCLQEKLIEEARKLMGDNK